MTAWSDFIPDSLHVQVVDVGASPIDGSPPYRPLLAAGRATVTGFEPDAAALDRLTARASPGERYFPHVVGDGRPARFRLCKAPGMSSTLELNRLLMGHFHGFLEWGTVVSERDVTTVRLDDVPGLASMDYLKLDVQGGELAVLEGARRLLSTALWVHTEVMFQDMYLGQPLFADQDRLLREAGFRLHCLQSPMVRTLKPLVVNDDAFAGMNQLLQADAVYVRDFVRLDSLDLEACLKVALVAHEVYRSYDLANLALMAADRKDGGDRSDRYVAALAQASAAPPG